MSSFEDKWDKFVSQNSAGSFLQSFDWGIFQEEAGRKARFVVMTGRKVLTFDPIGAKRHREKISSNLFLSALVLTHKLPFEKTYLYSPRGPVIDFLKFKKQKPVLLFHKFLQEMGKIAEKENAIFFRIDPEWSGNEYIKEFLKKLGFVKSSKEVQPRETIILDLLKSDEKLLEEMHQKTRYNIRLAERKGVKASRHHGVKDEDFEDVWRLMRETAKKDKFHLHPKKYYEKMLEILHDNITTGQYGNRATVNLFTAEYKNKLIAANFISFFGNRATYLHGASSDEYRNVMAPYLLHWEIVKEAKSRGCTEYDLRGISEEKWPGVTRFKRGFGGSEAKYVGAHDYVFDNKWFELYKLGQKLRRTLP